MAARADAREVALALLTARAPGATVCPSEVARALAGESSPDQASTLWRSRMPEVHAAVDGLVADGAIRLSWKGQPLETRAGPYRIARRGEADAPPRMKP